MIASLLLLVAAPTAIPKAVVDRSAPREAIGAGANRRELLRLAQIYRSNAAFRRAAESALYSATKATDLSEPVDDPAFLDAKFRDAWQKCAAEALRPFTTKPYDNFAFSNLIAANCSTEERDFIRELNNAVRVRTKAAVDGLAEADKRLAINFFDELSTNLVTEMRWFGSYVAHIRLRDTLLRRNAAPVETWLECLRTVSKQQIPRQEDMLEVQQIALKNCKAEQVAFADFNRSRLLSEGVAPPEAEEVIDLFVAQAPHDALEDALGIGKKPNP